MNYSAGDARGLTARVELLHLEGKTVMDRSVQLDCPEDSTATPMMLEYPADLTSVHYLRLTLTQDGKVRSTNFYLRGSEQGDFRAIRTLAQARVVAKTTSKRLGNGWLLSTRLENTSATPALFVLVQAERATSGDRIVPAIYDSNYIAIMPNETRTITTEIAERDTRGEAPRISVRGLNVLSAEHAGA